MSSFVTSAFHNSAEAVILIFPAQLFNNSSIIPPVCRFNVTVLISLFCPTINFQPSFRQNSMNKAIRSTINQCCPLLVSYFTSPGDCFLQQLTDHFTSNSAFSSPDSAVGSVAGLIGQVFGQDNHVGSFHKSTTEPPRLAKSSGFSEEQMCTKYPILH